MVANENKTVICPYCMKEHNVKIVCDSDISIFKGEEITFDARSLYCEESDEYFEDEATMKENDIAIKNAYRQKMGLLTSSEIVSIREKYGISQMDLCLLLGWGGKTIARYESSQVQDIAHDMLLRKISEDTCWYIDLLTKSKKHYSDRVFEKYYDLAMKVYENSTDYYLHEMIRTKCCRYRKRPDYYGNIELSFSKIVDLINYLAASPLVSNLYKVKLMKLMWYSDSLSYKKYGHSITGLPYLALPMGAVPESHNYIVNLSGVDYEMKIIDGNESYHFIPKDINYHSLTDEDKKVIDVVVTSIGNMKTESLVSRMHQEVAYKKTQTNQVISFDYAKFLSIDM